MPQTSAVNAYMVKWIRQAAVCSMGIARNAITYHVLSHTVLRNNHAMPTLLDKFANLQKYTLPAHTISAATSPGLLDIPPACHFSTHVPKACMAYGCYRSLRTQSSSSSSSKSSLSSSSKSLMTVADAGWRFCCSFLDACFLFRARSCRHNTPTSALLNCHSMRQPEPDAARIAAQAQGKGNSAVC